MIWLVRVEGVTGRGPSSDVLLVTKPTAEEAKAAVRAVVMPGVRVAEVRPAEGERP